MAEHAKHVENTRFIPFILESSGVYGKQASQFVQEVSKWAQSQGIRPDHFEENMRRCIGMSLMKSNCDQGCVCARYSSRQQMDQS